MKLPIFATQMSVLLIEKTRIADSIIKLRISYIKFKIEFSKAKHFLFKEKKIEKYFFITALQMKMLTMAVRSRQTLKAQSFSFDHKNYCFVLIFLLSLWVKHGCIRHTVIQNDENSEKKCSMLGIDDLCAVYGALRCSFTFRTLLLPKTHFLQNEKKTNFWIT